MTNINPVSKIIPVYPPTPRAPGWLNILANSGDSPIAADEFDDGVIDGNWVLVQPSGTQIIVEQNGQLSIQLTSTFASAHIAAYMRPLPEGSTFPMTLEIACRTQSEKVTFPYYAMPCPTFSDGTSTGSNIVNIIQYEDTTTLYANNRQGTFAAASSPNLFLDARMTRGTEAGFMYYRIIWSAVNTWKYGFSPDGVNWYHTSTESVTLTPTHWGLGWTTWSGAVNEARFVVYEYIRLYDSDLSV